MTHPATKWLTPALRERLAALLAMAQPRGQELWLVGGLLRDTWALARHDPIGAAGRPLPETREVCNVDLAVSRDALGLARAFAAAQHGTLVVLDESLGAARVILSGESSRDEFDLNDLRAPSIAEDLAKRDFTLNAMALPLSVALQEVPTAWESALLDPLRGRHDLIAGVLRAASPAAFQDDPVRILRGVSLAARYRWALEPATQQLMSSAVGELGRVAGERIRDELFKLFHVEHAADHVRLLDRLGALSALWPESDACRGTDQGPYHHLDVWAHSLETLAQFEALLDGTWYPDTLQAHVRPYLSERLAGDRTRCALLKLAALLHDLGKPATRSVDATGRLWFTGHEHLGAELAGGIAERLKLSTKEREALTRHIAAHLRPGFLSREPVLTERAIYRFFRDTQAAGPGVLLVWMADRLASRGPHTSGEDIPHQREIIARLLTAYFVRPQESVRPPRLVTGHDVMEALQLSSGPRVGELLEAIREAQVERRVTTKQQALQLARELLDKPQVTGDR